MFNIKKLMAKKKKNTIKITHTDVPATEEQSVTEEATVPATEEQTDDVIEQAITTEQAETKPEPVAKHQKEWVNVQQEAIPLVEKKQITTDEQKASARASYHPLVEGPSFGKLEYDPNL